MTTEKYRPVPVESPPSEMVVQLVMSSGNFPSATVYYAPGQSEYKINERVPIIPTIAVDQNKEINIPFLCGQLLF